MRSLFIRIGQWRFFRFLISGGLNTAVSYAVYLLLLPILSYQISYSFAYLAGIVISYFLNRMFVFRSHQGFRSVLLFPLVYVIQYGFSLSVLWLLVDKLRFDKMIAPIAVIILSIPLTYLLTRSVFDNKSVKIK